MTTAALGRIGLGIEADDTRAAQHAAEVFGLGYTGLWVMSGQLRTLRILADLVRATRAAVVAPAIIQLDRFSPEQITALFDEVEAEAPGRLLAGFGGLQAQPVAATRERLEGFDGRIPASRRLLAALGPRKLDAAREVSAGAITMFTSPEFTAAARRRLGADATLVVCQRIALDDDRSRARETLRGPLRNLLGMPGSGYAANMRRMGFGDADISGLSDRLVDAVASGGDPGTVAADVRAHLEAGADHVVLAAQTDGRQPGTIELARALAAPLGL
ncbi:TIGR03620 family F420-dependent LLM class oxidoreductase [Saccharopolyspora flava]|uniref:Probable F420-dependent oxidoreductase, MSMEG_4141 family n=1 Tax=Saccharopolyspora flava TaxID=95161 RepID=A0A1I6SVG2_9PSEU|nr:TIGR03620 family F420-dependent LLM class oxidoreductase [Saccharopolyspora flava]SFS80897.1 probable F420-dependent oxidoreductase, MSMEG_4141 family [Saccharopolyspora flava]